MIRLIASTATLALLTACGTAIPDDTQRGVGFGRPGDFAAAQGQSPGVRPQTVLPPGAAEAAIGAGQPLPSDIVDAVEGAEPEVPLGPDGFPDLTRRPEDEELFQPAPLPSEIQTALDGGADARVVAAGVGIEVEGAAPGGSTANGTLVEYALASDWPVGQRLFSRSLFGRNQVNENCAAYSTDDRAQEAFLNSGGPQRDPLRVDPDGDGYACGWTPDLLRSLAARAGE